MNPILVLVDMNLMMQSNVPLHRVLKYNSILTFKWIEWSPTLPILSSPVELKIDLALLILWLRKRHLDCQMFLELYSILLLQVPKYLSCFYIFIIDTFMKCITFRDWYITLFHYDMISCKFSMYLDNQIKYFLKAYKLFYKCNIHNLCINLFCKLEK